MSVHDGDTLTVLDIPRLVQHWRGISRDACAEHIGRLRVQLAEPSGRRARSGAGLEIRCTVLRTVGSNPTLRQ